MIKKYFLVQIDTIPKIKSYFKVTFWIMFELGLQTACWSYQVENFLVGLKWVERHSLIGWFFVNRDFIAWHRILGYITRYSVWVPNHSTMYSWQCVHLCYNLWHCIYYSMVSNKYVFLSYICSLMSIFWGVVYVNFCQKHRLLRAIYIWLFIDLPGLNLIQNKTIKRISISIQYDYVDYGSLVWQSNSEWYSHWFKFMISIITWLCGFSWDFFP